VAPAAAEPAAVAEPASPTTDEKEKKKEKVSRRLSTRITGLFTPKARDSKLVLFSIRAVPSPIHIVYRKEDPAPVTEEAPKLDEPAPVAPLAVEDPKEEAKPAPVAAAA
jgi:hypothetical protein